MLAVFTEFERDILRDRVKAGIAQVRKDGRPHEGTAMIGGKAQEVRNLARKDLSKSAPHGNSTSERLRPTPARRGVSQSSPPWCTIWNRFHDDPCDSLSREEEGDCGGFLFVERSWTADERTVPKIKSQEAVRIPRNADPDALPDFAGFVITMSEP